MFKILVSNQKIAVKFTALNVAVLLGFIFIAIIVLSIMANAKMEDRRHQFETNLELVMTSMVNRHNDVASGAITDAQAKDEAKDFIQHAIYSKTNYFWIIDTNANIMLHPLKPELDGKNQSAATDPYWGYVIATGAYIDEGQKQILYVPIIEGTLILAFAIMFFLWCRNAAPIRNILVAFGI